MKIGIYEVNIKEYFDPYLVQWTWIEAWKNGREVKYLDTLDKLANEFFEIYKAESL